MFTRVGRLTTFGAHAITNCPFRRDKTYQAPRVSTAKNDYQLFNFAQTLSDSTTSRPRTISAGDDPFIGVMTDEEHEVTKELELLDLDSWNEKKSILAPSEALRKPPDILDSFDEMLAMDLGGPTDGAMAGMSKLELEIDNASKMVDWDAWNRYLGEGDEKNSLNCFTNNSERIDQMERKIEIPVIPKEEDIEEYKPQICVTHQKPQPPPTITPFFHQSTRFTSGPLFYVPPKKIKKEEEVVVKKEEEEEEAVPFKLRSRREREVISPLRYVDEIAADQKSDTWLSDLESQADSEEEDRPRYKKRGVVMKPSVDEETDRRRALNRIAAVRYREKKRQEKLARKQEYQVAFQRNRILRQEERQLKIQIAEIRSKLQKIGAL